MGQRADVRVAMTSAQALVLHAWIAEHSGEIGGSGDLGRAARNVAWDLEAMLEKALPDVLSPAYEAVLADAVARVLDPTVP